ncbi:CHAP domain-containing protein [Pyxidicoccus fallax]|uniref:CHAP domain-containing protein n=1 Tax=Pyxidicoccus fallax TaxID=394095 RepID=A0A848LXD8_9BACT|nr:CHAP domain-containing protein [Pyxidicoccus fallax]NMO22270.1 CHAP domain-containing protein [Pyxidicoccus fallax]NPC84067.1 CHAP domain-containing protein [Pyxidicoccus fallax]
MRGALITGMLAMLATGCATTAAPLEPWLDSYTLRYRSASPPAFPRESLSDSVVAQKKAEPAPRAPVASRGGTGRKAAPRPAKKDVTPARATVAARPGASPRETVLATARSLVGKSQVVLGGRKYPSDCTGLIEGVYAQAGVTFRGTLKPGDNGVTAMYRHARAKGRVYTEGRPMPGDLVFFRETYDQNRDGRRNDGLTHVGIVDEVAADGTVTVIHRVRRGVVRYRMNLARPHLPRDPKTGLVLNDLLRHPGPNREPVLTGQLFSSFGSVLPAEPRTTRPVPVALR